MNKTTTYKNRYKQKKKAKRKHNFKISEHFSKKDFFCACGQCRKKLRISLGLIGALELLRSLARHKIYITKGFQCPDDYEKENSFLRNYHALGIAADITIENTSIAIAFKLAESIEEIKGLGLNITDNYLHIDTRKHNERTLWIEKDGEIHTLTDSLRQKYINEESTPL